VASTLPVFIVGSETVRSLATRTRPDEALTRAHRRTALMLPCNNDLAAMR
jgi:hypothetical protein